MTTTTASSPEDGREEGDEPESSHMRPASTTASWSSQGVSRGGEYFSSYLGEEGLSPGDEANETGRS